MGAVRVLLFAAGLWALHRELADTSMDSLGSALRAFGGTSVAGALAATIVSFLLLGLLEVSVVHAALGRHQSPSVPKIMRTAFAAHALSNALGVAILTGTAVRARSYERAGVDDKRIALVSSLVTIAVTLALAVLATWALLTLDIPIVVAGRSLDARLIALLLIVAVGSYLAWTMRVGSHENARGPWGVRIPPPGRTILQIGIACGDWLVTSAVLYALVSSGTPLSFLAFTRIYLVAQVVASASHVPAGAGVFEVVLLALVMSASPGSARASVLVAMVMFRVVYYLLPLAVALVGSGVVECRRARRPLGRHTVPFGSDAAVVRR